MKELLNEKNTLALDNETMTVIQKGAQIYNSLRNSTISIYSNKINGNLNLHDKKCLAIYLGLIQNDNFFRDELEKLNYQKFIDFSSDDTSNYHFEDEYYDFVGLFDSEDFLDILTLYLLEYPVIKELNLKHGYCTSKMKLAVYDHLGNKIKNAVKQKNTQKVLTK